MLVPVVSASTALDAVALEDSLVSVAPVVVVLESVDEVVAEASSIVLCELVSSVVSAVVYW